MKLVTDVIKDEKNRLTPFSWYYGQVIDNQDSNQSYKLKIRIYPFYRDVTDSDCPWVLPIIAEKNHQKTIPENDDWVLCTFQNNSLMHPMWLCGVYNLTDFQEKRTEINTKLQSIGLSALTYPDFDMLQVGDSIIVLNGSGEGAIITGQTSIIFSNTGGVKIKSGGNFFELANNPSPVGASIKADSAGIVTINGTLIKLGGDLATIPVNNLGICPLLAAPHGLEPTILCPPGPV